VETPLSLHCNAGVKTWVLVLYFRSSLGEIRDSISKHKTVLNGLEESWVSGLALV